MDNDLSHMRITIWLTLATLALVILFATFPSIDLKFSALFFSPVGQPWSGREPFPEWLRDTLREGTELATLLAFIVLVGNLRLGTLQRTGWRVWAFLCGPVILCAGLLVNGVLKATIGRARPFSVTEFGGQQLFTPPFQYSTQCYSNCSFSSGETALIASFFLPLCVLVWHRLQWRGRFVMGSIAAGTITLMSGLRIAAGGHFLSDVVMSILFSALTTLFLYRALAISRHRQLFTGDAVSADTASIWRNGRHAILTRVRRWWPKIKAAVSRLQRPPDAGTASS
ncbi:MULTISPECIES: phosphatase PAP2 family protein [unclassified Agrobacterium]|jgi:lipid A 4'-phosphatase|uniref:phosphatase PAP2 family protein n=1 Tax=unclassified Agrobacterium TaxID=2632611 RepID=UPI0024469143|nr:MULTISPECIES: phosphatase PAP2 family protein [unclassified Agrobacterium]MDH0613969.1 phosphatase PAP2 family protein [Agrobacterium sp. GD03872]MDH0696858.1 phosphatase PAP2 family protein [Agrobacterium sp. GD03871]MDH1059978.1 phosphatase PAP2 family protein [Agrobacterium sp. GD03992]MDH2209891.1 phosphatase PAP2 family protein [Agrobacterium sp. GD03643]MDH2219390.1 phosphatase PAP2 family protein [Agrobacterium sp. GD03638]